jgi:hypothetical protein
MTESTYKRWYEEDTIVEKCLSLLENLEDSKKRQTSVFLMDEIINKDPYTEMIPDKIFGLATEETQKRRWYDFDQTVRIFVELLRHVSPEERNKIAILAISFIEDLD